MLMSRVRLLRASFTAKSAQSQIMRRVFFECLEAQRTAERYHCVFYPQVAKSLAL